MVLAVRVDRLVARDRLADVDTAHQPHVVEQLERAVDARHPDALTAIAQAVRDLLRGDAATELVERRDDGCTWRAHAVATALEGLARVSNPVAHPLAEA